MQDLIPPIQPSDFIPSLRRFPFICFDSNFFFYSLLSISASIAFAKYILSFLKDHLQQVSLTDKIISATTRRQLEVDITRNLCRTKQQ